MHSYPALLLALILLAASSAQGDTVVVTADRMVDVLAGRVVDRPRITIKDGRISAVATQGAAGAGGARRIDLPGMTQPAGLIDMHMHLTHDPRFSGYRSLELTDNFRTVVGVARQRQATSGAQPGVSDSVIGQARGIPSVRGSIARHPRR